eukprot:SAG31_NODE_140_length_22731_cov_10.941410_15_plen_64_part_00
MPPCAARRAARAAARAGGSAEAINFKNCLGLTTEQSVANWTSFYAACLEVEQSAAEMGRVAGG